MTRRKSFSPELLEQLRAMPVAAALDALGLYWKKDPDFTPVKYKNTVRLNVAVGGGAVEPGYWLQVVRHQGIGRAAAVQLI